MKYKNKWHNENIIACPHKKKYKKGVSEEEKKGGKFKFSRRILGDRWNEFKLAPIRGNIKLWLPLNYAISSCLFFYCFMVFIKLKKS